MKRIYLDYAATTPVDPRVHEAMEPALGPLFGNPSSIHGFGQEALAAVENARETVSLLLNASPEEVIFTSGGTESDNSAIWSACSKGGHIVTSAVEHHAVLHACQFMQIEGLSLTVVPVDKDGIVDPDDVERALTPKTVLVSVMHANNEIGTIQPIAEIRKRVRDKEIPFHTDAVQTFGHMPVDVKALHVDFLSLSAHKLCGPKGSGALYIRKGMHFIPLIHGGGQERNRRSSTHNVPGIVGLGKAVELARAEMVAEQKRIRTLRDRLYERIRKDL
ncbi:MAG TPA: cysteine desulfurase family protein, partial [bacterium]